MAIKKLFVDADGLRGGWRALLFAATAWYLPEAFYWAANAFLGYVPGNGFSAVDIAFYGFSVTASSLIVALVLTRSEKHDFSWFGFPWRWSVVRPFSWGLLAGAGMVTVLMGIAVFSGHASVDGLALHGWQLLKYLGLWVGGMLLLGFAEELFYRGYALRAVAGSIGFWPAAMITSVLFGGVHYFFKPMETTVDILSIVLLALFLCFTIRRSGTIWFAIGFHAAFDFFALAFYGSPNTGNNGLALDKHILASHISGPVWLTGGSQGLEASWLVVPLVIGMAWLFHRYQPTVRYVLPAKQPLNLSAARGR